MMARQVWIHSLAGMALAGGALAGGAPAAAPTPQNVLARSAPADWRALDPDNTLYMELPGGRVVIELAPHFAPGHVANIKALVRAHYFDGLNIIRVQDNYVVQWGDPDGKRDTGSALHATAPEFFRPLQRAAPFHRVRQHCNGVAVLLHLTPYLGAIVQPDAEPFDGQVACPDRSALDYLRFQFVLSFTCVSSFRAFSARSMRLT